MYLFKLFKQTSVEAHIILLLFVSTIIVNAILFNTVNVISNVYLARN